MRKKLMTLALAGSLAFGSAGVAMAGPGNNNGAGPDANGPAKKGLCTAYFNGQKNGHGKNGNNPPPFANLEAAAEEADDSDASTVQKVYNFCSDVVIGGNPGQNGRYPSCFDDGDCDN